MCKSELSSVCFKKLLSILAKPLCSQISCGGTLFLLSDWLQDWHLFLSVKFHGMKLNFELNHKDVIKILRSICKRTFKSALQKPALRMKYVPGKIHTGFFNSCLNTVFQVRVSKISRGNDCITCSSVEQDA